MAMENEQRHYELRSGSRSRSQTPLVHSRALVESESLEHNYDLRNRSRERSHTPGESTSSRRSGSRSLPGSSSKTHEQSMDTIMEKKEEVFGTETHVENQSKRPENSTISTRKMERRSERQKAKREIFANGQNDNKDNSFDRKVEKKYKSNSPHRMLTSDYSSEEGEREDLPSRPSTAHEIYKQAGDWWNVFPKTDYTYSQKSQCRYEVAPGILAMPNMSRRSIHSDSDSSNRLSHGPSESMYQSSNNEDDKEKNAQNCTFTDENHELLPEPHTSNLDARPRVQYTKKHIEQYHSHREVVYTVPRFSTNARPRQLLRSAASAKCIGSRKHDVTSMDSDTELEDAVSVSSKPNERRRITQYFTSLTTTIVLWFSKLLEFLKIKTVRRREYRTTYEYQRYESRGYKAWQHIDRCLQYIYLFMVKALLLDSWLLSRVSSIRKWVQQKSPISMVLWITLLPLLLLTGYWCLPYLSTSFLPAKIITRHIREDSELYTVDKRSFFKPEDFGTGDNFKSIAEELYRRVNSLEDRTSEQTNRLLNISRALEQLKENDFVWSKYNNEMLLLEKNLDHTLGDTHAHEISAIKMQFKTLKELYSELKSCCNTHAKLIDNEDLEKRIEMILAAYLGDLISKKNSINMIHNTMVADDVKDSETLRDKSWGFNDNVITDERVHEIVRNALRIYDADKTGRVDYALETAGGQIISTRCTQKYDIKTRAFKVLAFTLYHENNNPRTVIQGNPIQPGACWAFQGFPGYLLIKLRSSIYITGFTVEHAPKSILPNGEMRSAPRKFNVWGFIDENDSAPVMFGDYEFAASDDSLQYFPIQNTTIEKPYEYVELRVHSNHGQLEYTCLYRFRVHGRPV
ncbi:uncharacterized protein LOC143149771 isoform X3 [Ptiloglossa arizonensis]|uniref:uncharacterized protein LOC143149771 isoform X3 n=1 Tax=Ptiloglossa arizonensis TaxID=3350558 RepID=UPI003F9F4A79